MNITVEYTGSYPTLCFGEWIVTIDGTQLDTTEWGPMETRGEYRKWYFDENYSEEWETYQDGYTFPFWLKSEAKQMVMDSLTQAGISINIWDLYDMYNQIQQHDFRHNSCGGCI